MPEQTETVAIIIGAGPSGLSTAAYFHHLSIPYILLEREDCSASLWKKYSYDRVHLHLPKQFCQLPFMPFPKTYPTYVSKNEFVQYLDDYASHFNIKPIFRRAVEAAEQDPGAGKWRITAREVGGGGLVEYCSRFLVVATGETCDASIPVVEGLENFAGEILHSTNYKNGKRFEEKNVLVVGSGNSGFEICLDLADHRAKTSMVIRSPIHVLSRRMVHLGLFLLKHHVPYNLVDNIMIGMSKIVYGDLTRFGIHRPKEGPFALKVKYGKYPVIDIGTMPKIYSREIQVLPGISSMKSSSVVFKNGKEHPFDVIIFATGFKRHTRQWLKGDDYLLNEDGLPKNSFPEHWKGKDGLYCAGLARMGLYGAGLDAEKIAHDIKAQL